MIRPFEILRDEQGYAAALAVDGYVLLDLQRGTVRNQETVGKMLAVLNAAVALVNAPATCGVSEPDLKLAWALLDLRPSMTDETIPKKPVDGAAGM